VDDVHATEPSDFIVPREGDLMKFVQQKIQSAKSLLADPPVTEIKTEVVRKGSKDKTEE
jgi:hypothetical protein